ncbi:hypothetical protein SISSUDRAFT_640698 [Sistotremastrum suecicum HHB10207 ss-3]|uniref:Arrestin-like N-terminal domain-containing protein n=1 Tax=Sistotremastrum suecicum HHB10207 ss-3 TaxID=1314776 RepID=A0A166ECG3_9AGAM|nr:hypothetical protein SISSUDRAFT_640698 [Sistotremastrum suecicum HHB10207 ss-3]
MLEKNDFKQISLKITGTLRRTFREQATFLDESTLIWTPKDDHNALQNLPFSVPLPTNGRNKEYQSSPFPLPNSFSGDQLTVTYALSLVISRGVLRPAVTLRSSFNYVQMPMPHPPSPLMLRAYTERTPLSGPAVDGDGWFKSPVSEVSATLYSEPPRTLETTLYLALPRMYSRTSYIPIRLMLKCSDSHVLDLFSKPGIPRLCLVRRESIRLNRGIIKSDEKTSDIRLVGVAKTWLAPKPENDKDDVVMFCAEIPLNPNLIPNFAVGELSVKYYVVLLPWLAPGLSTSAAPNVALIQQEVDIIATPLSPSPVSSAPPQAIVHDITLDRWAAMAKRKGNETFFDMRHLSFGR